MASTANLLRLRPKFPGIPNPSFTRFFSSTPSDNEDNHIFSSTPSDNDDESNPSPPQSKSSLSSYFSDVKSSLKKPSHSPNSSPPPKPSNDSSTTNTDAPNSPSKAATLEDIRKNLSEYRSRAAADDDGNKPSKDSSTTNTGAPNSPSKAATLEEIRKNLSEYRSRTAAPPSSDDDGNKPSFSQSQPISFQDIYKRSLIDKDKGNNNNTTTNPNQQPSGTFGFDAIKSSLSRLKSSVTNQAGGQVNSSASFSRFTDSLKHKGMDPNPNPNPKGASLVIGGSGTLPLSVFGNELRDKNAASDNDNEDPKTTDFLTNYSYPELGEKLRLLRPENKGKNWFTLTELNERLIQLRKYEIKENKRRGGAYFNDLRSSIVQLGKVEDDKKRSATMQRLSLLGKMGGVETRSHTDTLSTPKEHLIENYFHPDNMSSAEKLKVELTKVRDEFKMSESDCGSSRVQVALLTTKIKHLSTALHKKDKHSRKGLMAMIQRRKKLLKYLRRTDWVSYCLVLSKLGLRDNPDYKA